MADISSDFDVFHSEASTFLPVDTVKKIAYIFEYSMEEIREYEHQKDPGYSFISSLNQKHIIHPNDISKLVNALKIIDQHNIAQNIETSYQRSRGKAQITALKAKFIEELRKTYRDASYYLQPISFRKEHRFPVDQVFFDRSIYLLNKQGMKTSWEKLKTYHRIFDDPRITSSRIIFSAKAAYGKSTLALKFASDWCNKCNDSPLKDVEIFILLRLRRLNRSTSLCEDIKRCLLSKKSGLKASDVEKILNDSKSVVLILEGFDKYDLHWESEEDEVTKILKGLLFPHFRVIVTTSLSCKPTCLDPMTPQLTLRELDEEEQDSFIRKALQLDKQEEFEELREQIRSNPVMQHLSNVPFILPVILSLVSEDGKHRFFNSATAFFRFVFASFHGHKTSKMRDEDRAKYSGFKPDHSKLDKVAFESLTEEGKVKPWVKDDLQEKIGKDVYDYYKALEILDEEEILNIDTKPFQSTSLLAETSIKTAFYHEIFMQWFAASYIAHQATKTFKGFSDRHLKNLLEKNHTYVFLFVCGINSQALQDIVKFLNKQGSGKYKQLIDLCNREGKMHTDNL